MIVLVIRMLNDHNFKCNFSTLTVFTFLFRNKPPPPPPEILTTSRARRDSDVPVFFDRPPCTPLWGCDGLARVELSVASRSEKRPGRGPFLPAAGRTFSSGVHQRWAAGTSRSPGPGPPPEHLGCFRFGGLGLLSLLPMGKQGWSCTHFWQRQPLENQL